MNKKVYIIGTVIVVLLIAMFAISGSKNTSVSNERDFLATSTVSEISTTTGTVSSSNNVVKSYTMAEVAANKDAVSCWTTIDGKVYDLTKAIDLHPGGREKILSICGKDGTSAFTNQHGGQEKPESFLDTLVIGTLAN